jgi:hypothetical protein
MVHYSRLALAGIILLVFGVTMAGTSYFKLYDTAIKIFPPASVLPIQANSSADFYFWHLFGGFPQTERAVVVVAGSQELQDLLDPISGYNSTMRNGQNITISLIGDQTLSATVMSSYSFIYDETIALHSFDVPASWWAGFHICVNNPESYPVCWIVNVMVYGQVINNDWIAVFLVGIVAIILGLVIGIIGYRKKSNFKK